VGPKDGLELWRWKNQMTTSLPTASRHGRCSVEDTILLSASLSPW
jgi:hypothetical protein